MATATFAATIRARRVELGIRQRSLAATLGYTQSSPVSRIEAGANPCPGRLVPVLAAALEIDGEALARLWLNDHLPELAATIDLPPVAR